LESDRLAGYKNIFKIEKEREIPDEASEQLWGAIGAVIGSWNNDRAICIEN
jgi:pyruvate,orthophosphate dikinase